MKAVLICLEVLTVYFIYGMFAQEPDLDMHKMMSKVENYTEFCEMIGMTLEECEQNVINQIPSDGVDENGEKMVVGGSIEIAKFDPCNPREQTIALPRHPDPDITVWPTCTRALRCGGCCTSDVFSCEPTEISKKFVKVFDTRLPYAGAHRFEFLGVRSVTIIEHTECDAQCKTKKHECHKYQTYEARRCRCVCRPERLILKKTCRGNQIWDDNECDCICPNRNTMKCPDPSYFSTTTCKCTLKTSVTGEIDLDKLFEQLDKGLIGTDILLENHDNDITAETDIDMFAGNKHVGEETGTEEDTERKPVTEDGKSDKTEGESEETSETMTDESKTPKKEKEKETKVPTTTTTSTTTTTPTTSTTTPTTTTTPAPPTTTEKPKVTEDPCKHVKCFSIWKPKMLSNGRCQCFPPWPRQGR